MPAVTTEYAIGDHVLYADHQGRVQNGDVLAIEVTWHRFSGPDKPCVTYTLEHPTYRNRKHYAGADKISGLANT